MSGMRPNLRPLLWAAVLLLSACTTLPRGEVPTAPVGPASEEVRQAEIERQAWLAAHPDWAFQGRVAVSRGKDGGSGRVDWQQREGAYRVQLSAPVTRQSWVLEGDAASGAGRLEGLEGGPRAGADAEQVLLEATGWRIPVNRLAGWVRGQVDPADAPGLELDGQARPRVLREQDWVIEFQEWFPAQEGLPALPRRIEARSGDARVRLMLDQWQESGP